MVEAEDDASDDEAPELSVGLAGGAEAPKSAGADVDDGDASDEPDGTDVEDTPEATGADELDAVLLAKFMAFCWNAAKVLVALGFTAKTIPLWQWLESRYQLGSYGSTRKQDLLGLAAVEPERRGRVAQSDGEGGEARCRARWDVHEVGVNLWHAGRRELRARRGEVRLSGRVILRGAEWNTLGQYLSVEERRRTRRR